MSLQEHFDAGLDIGHISNSDIVKEIGGIVI